MKFTIALILFVGGTALMLLGFIMAVREIALLYGSTLSDPMADGPDAKQTSSTMLTWVIVGAVGIIPATAGSIMMGKGIISRIVKRFQKPEQPPQ